MKGSKYLIILHLTVFIWGFTGIIGEFVDMDQYRIVWYRLGIASLSLFIFLFLKNRKKYLIISRTSLLKYFGIGCIIMFHWLTFFWAIKETGVKVAIVCMATSAFFMAILEPVFLRKKVQYYKFFLGLASFVGIYLIYQTDVASPWGIFLGVTSAMLACLFTVMNAKLVQKEDAKTVTFWELFGGFLGISLILLFMGDLNSDILNFTPLDISWLIILGVVCTSVAFLVSVWLMKFISPFTISLTINLEPIYTILLMMLIEYFLDDKVLFLEGKFYLGTSIILVAVFVDIWFSRRLRKGLAK
jgi:drug/metabolite transporter (DMT)-like permease